MATGRGAGGQRAVANHDEDSITMGVEAALACLADRGAGEVGTVLFASCSSPYIEKQAATLLAAVCQAPPATLTADLGGSTRAVAAALAAAAGSVGPGRQALVVAADCRPAEQGSDLELQFGDAAAAVLLGAEDGLARLEGTLHCTEEFTDYWRRARDAHVRKGDDGFIHAYGYTRLLTQAIRSALARWGITAADQPRVLVAGPSARLVQGVQRALELPRGCFLPELHLAALGDTGNAQPLLLLAEALEAADPGQPIVLAMYGSGNADVLLFRATAQVARVAGRGTLAARAARARPIGSYYKFLQFRGHLPGEATAPFASLAIDYREQGQNLRLQGSRCTGCGRLAYPPRRVCDRCGAIDQTAPFQLSRRGTVYTFNKDHVYPSMDPPTVMAVAELEGGGRFFGQMTDCDAAEVAIGMPVQLTFRRLHEGGDYINYFWKLRPVAKGEQGHAE